MATEGSPADVDVLGGSEVASNKLNLLKGMSSCPSVVG